jgi:hypothetical protein
MAPTGKSGTKRQQQEVVKATNSKAATTAAANDAKKARKVDKEKESVVDPVLQPIVEAVEAAGETITDSCQAMLIAMLPSLTLASDLRDASQIRMVAMLREVLESVQAQRQAAVTAEEQLVTKAEAARDLLVAAAAEAQATATAVAEASATHKAAAAEAESHLTTKTDLLKAAQEAQQSGDAALLGADAERLRLQEAIDGPLRILCSGDEWSAAAAADHCQSLMALVTKLGNADESLLMSVPACVKKAPTERGEFDKMVVETVEKGLKDRVSELTATLAAGETGKAERAAAVEASQLEVNAAESAKAVAAGALAGAVAAKKTAVAASQAAKLAAQVQESEELAKAQLARDAKQATLETFQKRNMACFAELESKVSPALQAGA